MNNIIYDKALADRLDITEFEKYSYKYKKEVAYKNLILEALEPYSKSEKSSLIILI